MTDRNPPEVKSSTGEDAALSRSIDLGVNTTSGRRGLAYAWRRNRWKCDAGVDGRATVMLFSAHICRQASIRPDEWSGPWPSYPCGSSRTTLERWPHFCSELEMNSSTIVWAPLPKSPNCASQQTRTSGASTEYPYSKPIAANSLIKEL